MFKECRAGVAHHGSLVTGFPEGDSSVAAQPWHARERTGWTDIAERERERERRRERYPSPIQTCLPAYLPF